MDRAVDNSRFVSCSNDKLVFIWDVGTGRIITKYRGHAAPVLCVRFNADCTVVGSSSYDATVRLWDLRSNAYEPIQVPTAPLLITSPSTSTFSPL